MENFFVHFHKRTGLTRPEANKTIRIVSGFLVRHYKREFAIIMQYFLSVTFDRSASGNNLETEQDKRNQTI
ncbi:MAG TPA: hypothetical protein VFZ78_02875 [Flavisolibacter sp.]